jgi:phosphoribosylaminoimidazole carboxylase
MLAAEASLLNIPLIVLDVGSDAPAKQILANVEHVDGSFTDPQKIRDLAKRVDVLTVEIEHVDVKVLEELQSKGVTIHPSPSTIKTIQDKYLQKEHLRRSGCPVADYVEVASTNMALQDAAAALGGFPFMLKSKTLAYDGRGNFAVKSAADFQTALSALGNRPLYAEKWVPFEKEIAVMVVRSASGEVRSYPVVETVHKENICHLVFAPLRVLDPTVAVQARIVAENAIKSLQGAGVFGVEMFLGKDGL